ncbi:polymorphic toxin type 24 domain-containing protein [Crocosphaera sp. UHCC 0190]|uniref:polymorphic toxin type 24 domain-containing protein n=1 Tax=unclassified Crocosphaera TaxID=2623705 RepID=UPI002B1EDD97|nr:MULTISPECIES: polymorphic toxin type 24 domain-containing protein [unclassified Crocosphaera]MEA5509508.1 polymorphic toxin type 24 domain-containing protein [Crocosphaera sp. UHCC 0190]MEA5534765.1 polymorphic toxin type 24 domain-containing protein [Crocosphaera sp. XPORK-15E]
MVRPVDWTIGIPAADLIAQGKRFQGNFPVTQAKPREVLYRSDNVNITSYIVYDDNGKAIKRVDLRGRSHADIPTPHVVEYNHNKSPRGTIFVQASRTVRPARMDEIP